MKPIARYSFRLLTALLAIFAGQQATAAQPAPKPSVAPKPGATSTQPQTTKSKAPTPTNAGTTTTTGGNTAARQLPGPAGAAGATCATADICGHELTHGAKPTQNIGGHEMTHDGGTGNVKPATSPAAPSPAAHK